MVDVAHDEVTPLAPLLRILAAYGGIFVGSVVAVAGKLTALTGRDRGSQQDPAPPE